MGDAFDWLGAIVSARPGEECGSGVHAERFEDRFDVISHGEFAALLFGRDLSSGEAAQEELADGALRAR